MSHEDQAISVEDVEKAIATFYWKYVSGELNTGQFLIRVNRVRQRCHDKGIKKEG
ncbi:Uncharacterised protein [uncultured archaeon]|nr:Uncharacterised protein [uncultured archaeon]